MSLAGRGAVVTGGGRGIGAAVARALAAAGAEVIVAARTRTEIESVAEALGRDGGRARAVPCDVTDEESVRGLARAAAELPGGADILVNGAGVASSAAVEDVTLQEWERVLRVNATGTFLCIRALLPAMLERGRGRVVNVASTAGLGGAAYISAYSASKHAVVGLTRSVAAETAGGGVTVNAVCPGYVDTTMTEESVERIVARTGRDPEEALRVMLASVGQRRLIEPGEVARTVLALCGDEADGINGQALRMDGA